MVPKVDRLITQIGPLEWSADWSVGSCFKYKLCEVIHYIQLLRKTARLSKNKCGPGHRKLRVCVVKHPVSSSSISSPSHTFSSSSYFVMYFMRQPSSLLHNHQTLILRFFLQTDRQTDWPPHRLTKKCSFIEAPPQSLKSCWGKGI